MNKHTSKITTKSIEQSGLPNDYKKAIAEYVWNGFDAGATEVKIDFEGNELGHLSSFSISDNGTGIDIVTIDDTFGNFLDSHKANPSNKIGFVKGRKGKGRYSFSTFANSCTWLTTFKGPDGELLQYSIRIQNGDLQNFSLAEQVIVKGSHTGTIVSFHNFYDLTSDLLSARAFEYFLASEFGWFLFLNRDKGCKILINGEELAYTDIIGDSEEMVHEIGEDSFKVVFIRWTQKIGDKYYFYFLSENQKEAARKHTSFNNKAIDFHHSVYVESSFFDDFKETTEDNPVLDFSGKNQTNLSYKSLLKALNTLVSGKEKQFIRDLQADKLIQDYYFKSIFPVGTLKADGLEAIIKELYCAEPRIFQGLTIHQSKTLVGLFNVLLANGQGAGIVEVVDSVVVLNQEERERLSQVLANSVTVTL
ncbi:MAG: ATP-binding protein [Bacteroidota bacterium]